MMNIHLWDNKEKKSVIFFNAQHIILLIPNKLQIKDNEGKVKILKTERYEVQGIFEHEGN